MTEQNDHDKLIEIGVKIQGLADQITTLVATMSKIEGKYESFIRAMDGKVSKEDHSKLEIRVQDLESFKSEQDGGSKHLSTILAVIAVLISAGTFILGIIKLFGGH